MIMGGKSVLVAGGVVFQHAAAVEHHRGQPRGHPHQLAILFRDHSLLFGELDLGRVMAP